MMFLARSAFWLSVVYLHLPATEAAKLPAPSAVIDMASSRSEDLGRRAAAQAASGAAQFCQANPQTCFGAALEGGAGRATDTLTAADREPKWIGRKGPRAG